MIRNKTIKLFPFVDPGIDKLATMRAVFRPLVGWRDTSIIQET